MIITILYFGSKFHGLTMIGLGRANMSLSQQFFLKKICHLMCYYLNVLKVFHLVCIKFLLPNIFTLFLRLEKNDLICSITQTKNIIFTM